MMKKYCILLFFVLHASVFTLQAQRTITSERIEVTNALDEHPDAAAMAIVAAYRPAVDSVMAPILGESLVGMSAARPESLLSNWAADVMAEFSTFDNGEKADMGLVNVGGLRNNMPKGTVRRGDIILISPFDNKLCVAYLKGSDLLALMQDIAAVRGEGVSHEVRMTITNDGKLKDVTLSGKPIDPERTYRVATLDYLAEGNDKLYSLKKSIKVNVSNLYTRDCMMQSIAKHKKITSALEGRVRLMDN